MEIQFATDNIGSTILNYAVFLASVGTIVMALQEVVKNLLRWRLTFNRKQFERWLKDHDDARREFITLTTGGYESQVALFDQPVEKMMGQVQAAANMALDFPKEYPHLYQFLTSVPTDQKVQSDQATWHKFASKPSPEMAKVSSEETNDAAKARARLGNLVTRKLDSFQNETQYSWAGANQKVSVAAGAGLIAIILFITGFPSKHPQGQLVGWALLVVLSIVGGMTAPFAKDIVSGLSQFGKSK